MCIAAAAGAMAGGKISDAIFRPHRMLGLRGPLEFMFHPNDKYNRARQESAPAPTTTGEGEQQGQQLTPAIAGAVRRKQAKQPTASGYGSTTPLSVGGG